MSNTPQTTVAQPHLGSPHVRRRDRRTGLEWKEWQDDMLGSGIVPDDDDLSDHEPVFAENRSGREDEDEDRETDLAPACSVHLDILRE
jgi:hypothetical protein